MITTRHQSNEVSKAKRAQTKKGTLHSEQARGSEPRNRIFNGRRITLKQPTCHRITDSRVADVKDSHITPPKHAHSPATAENIYCQLIGECSEGQ